MQYHHRPGSSHRAPQPPAALLDPSQFIRPSRLVRILAPTKPTPATAVPAEKDSNAFKIVAHCPRHSSTLEKSQCCFDSHPPAVWSCRGGAAEEGGEAAATSTWAPRPSRRCFSIAITLCIIIFIIVVTLAVVWTLVIQKEK